MSDHPVVRRAGDADTRRAASRLARSALATLLALALLPLAGCLEVEQHPPWREGRYDGKPDAPHAQAYFHGNRLAWWGVIADRNQLQNEYLRVK